MYNYVTSFAVGKTGGGANTGTSLETIKKGDILIVDYNSGAVLTGTSNTITTNPVIAIVSCKEDGVPIVSGPIYGQTLVGGGKSAYVAPAYTKKGFGYTSASTSVGVPAVAATASNYDFSIVLKTDLRLHPNKQDRLDFSVTSVGGYDLAKKAVLAINAPSDINPKLDGQKHVTAIVTSNGTPGNIGTAATATVTKGITKVTFSAAHGRSVGDIIYFPNGGTYKVAAVPSTTVITLDMPYTGESEVYLADTVQVMTSVTLFGVVITANQIKYSNPVDQYNQIDFEVGLSENWAVSPVTITTYNPGKGTGWQLRDKEIACMGWTGYTDRRDVMRAEFPFATSIALNYLTVELSYKAPVRGDLQQMLDGNGAVFIAFDNAASTQSTAVLAILNPWATSGGVSLS
jgi:hypothetical protein